MSALFNLNLYNRVVLLFMLWRYSFLTIYIFININQIACMTLSIQLRANQIKLTWCHNEFYWSKLNCEFGKTEIILIATDFTSIVNNYRQKNAKPHFNKASQNLPGRSHICRICFFESWLPNLRACTPSNGQPATDNFDHTKGSLSRVSKLCHSWVLWIELENRNCYQ